MQNQINVLTKENSQLKVESNRMNLEYEKLEMRFAHQVDEYEIEVEGLSNKLKDKDSTIKVLYKWKTLKS